VLPLRVAACCRILQCVAASYSFVAVRCEDTGQICSVLQRVAVCYIVLQCATMCCRDIERFFTLLKYVAERSSALQCIAVRCSALQCVAVRCSALQCVAVRCSVLRGQIGLLLSFSLLLLVLRVVCLLVREYVYTCVRVCV